MAPEVADINRLSDESSDIWSFGMLLIEMIDTEIPFNYSNLSERSLYRAAAAVNTPPRFKRRGFSNLLQTILSNQILCIDPTKRLSARELITVRISGPIYDVIASNF